MPECLSLYLISRLSPLNLRQNPARIYNGISSRFTSTKFFKICDKITTYSRMHTFGSQSTQTVPDNDDPYVLAHIAHLYWSLHRHSKNFRFASFTAHEVPRQPEDGESGNEHSQSGGQSSSSSTAGARPRRASARRALPRSRNTSTNDGDDGGEERPPQYTDKIPSQCESVPDHCLTPAEVVSKLEPHNIHMSLDHDAANTEETFIGRLSRQLMDTFSNMTLFNSQHQPDSSMGADSTFSLNLSVASISDHDQSAAPIPLPVIEITPAKPSASSPQLSSDEENEGGNRNEGYFTGRGNPVMTPVQSTRRNVLLLPSDSKFSKSRPRSRSVGINRPYMAASGLRRKDSTTAQRDKTSSCI